MAQADVVRGIRIQPQDQSSSVGVVARPITAEVMVFQFVLFNRHCQLVTGFDAKF